MQRECEDLSAAVKAYGERTAKRLHQRIKEIKAAESIEELIQFKIGRCHPLSQNRDGQYAMDLIDQYRLVFIEYEKHIQVKIIEIVDYHDHKQKR